MDNFFLKTWIFLLIFFQVLSFIQGQDNFSSDLPSGWQVLPSPLNSTNSEKTPRITLDGKRLFYEKNTGNPNNYSNIWMADRKGNFWENVRSAPPPLNNQGYNFVASSAGNGTALLLGNIYDSVSNSSEKGISISYKTSKGWTFPQKQHIENFYNQNKYCDYFLAHDLRRLYMSLERKDSYGGLDIYVSKRTGPNHWTEPKNIGPEINSKEDEVFPFLASDNKTLYFSSNRPGGYGAMDIYMTRHKDEDTQKWAKPENLGPTINSSRNELGFYMAANQSKGYFYTWLNDSLQSVIIEGTIPADFIPKKVNLLKGKVLDNNTRKPLGAEIKIINAPGANGLFHANPLKGNFVIPLPHHKDSLLLEITHKGYISNIISVKPDYSNNQKSLDKAIYLTPAKQNDIREKITISFEEKSNSIPSGSFSSLEALITYVEKSTDLYFLIKTNDEGPLANKRMSRLKEFLVANGIPSSRILSSFSEKDIQKSEKFTIRICKH